jgi:hypothetical protein
MGVLSPRNLPHRLRWGLARGLGVLVKGKVVRWPGGPEWDTGWFVDGIGQLSASQLADRAMPGLLCALSASASDAE